MHFMVKLTHNIITTKMVESTIECIDTFSTRYTRCAIIELKEKENR